jgi:protein-S-isoprenylcysteine O-methyltransferase Ste14
MLPPQTREGLSQDGRRIKAEEAMHVKKFGEEYRQYIKQTQHLVPFLL